MEYMKKKENQNRSRKLSMKCVMPFREYDLFYDPKLYHRTSKQQDKSWDEAKRTPSSTAADDLDDQTLLKSL